MSSSIDPDEPKLEPRFVDITPTPWPRDPSKRLLHKQERINKRKGRRRRKR